MDKITEENIRQQVRKIYEQGGDPDVFLTTPEVKRKISEYLFTGTPPEWNRRERLRLYIADKLERLAEWISPRTHY